MPSTATVHSFLRHVSLNKTVPYEVITEIQNNLVAQQLKYKALNSSSSAPQSKLSLPDPPYPHILTFGTSPVYTFGRRERISTLPKSVIESLIAPMPGIPGTKSRPNRAHRALLFETSRGGQTTFHGPGQLLMWPILDIKSNWPACGPLNVRSYVRLLEESTILTLEHFGCKGVRSRLPGVWEESGEKKIAALGVHLRRNISSYGVACNLNTDLRFYERIKACGLEGNRTTTVRELTGKSLHPLEFGKVWVENMAKLLYGTGTEPSSTTITSNATATSNTCVNLNTATSTPSIPLEKRIQKRGVDKIGLKPEILRRLWYLNVPRSMIKWAQDAKKIRLDQDHDQIKKSLPKTSLETSTCTDDNVNQPAQDDVIISGAKSSDLDALLGILDGEPKESIQPSYRKCAGISYWSPPIDRASLSSVVRKVAVTSIRGQEKK